MLINVIPNSKATQSAVVFSVVFEDLEPELPNPQSWTSQLQCLQRDGFEVPKAIHALDKSAGIVSLLQDITFDLSTMVISCQFVDGSSEQWPLPGEGCLDALQKILRDVNESSLEIDRELQREKEKEREREHRFSEFASPAGKTTRHKRQRSLLMTLVACVTAVSRRSTSVFDNDRSIIPLYTPSSSRFPSPPPTPINPTVPNLSISPRARRRKARSELVDAFRRYALSELSAHFPPGGYYTWIIQSMLRRATEAVDNILKHNKDWTLSEPNPMTHCYPEDSKYFSITAASLPPTPSVSDDEGGEGDTDTDGSSLHTPSASLFNVNTFRPLPADNVRNHRRSHSLASSSRHFSYPGDQAEYTNKVFLINRLHRLLTVENARQAQIDDEMKHHYDVLEIRSRRRAYLNKELRGSVRWEWHLELALVVPTTSSPLAQHSWSGEEYEYAPDERDTSAVCCETIDYNDYSRFELRLQRTKPSKRGGAVPTPSAATTTTTRLFPVSEEEEEVSSMEEEADDLAFDGLEIDLESGLKHDSILSADGVEIDVDGAVVVGEDEKNGIRVALEVERPQHRPRMRTSSMYVQRIRTPAEPPLVTVPPRTPRLSRPLLPTLESADVEEDEEDLQRENLPVYTELDVNASVGVRGYRGGDGVGEAVGGFGDEFTLAMDLPLSVRVRDRDIFEIGKGMDVDVDVDEERMFGWDGA